VGVEADFQGAVERDNENFSSPFSCSFCAEPTTGTVLANYTTQIDWFGTVRGRIGYVWGNGNVMSYITGGLAYGEVKVDGTTTVSGAITGSVSSFSGTQAFGHSQVNTGWVAGYGTEGRLANTNWTWKIEGLYMDLGHVDTAGGSTRASLTGIFCEDNNGHIIPCNQSAGNITTHTHFTDGILRGGLNYKFY
jgi:outer membrane immunogenic protein